MHLAVLSHISLAWLQVLLSTLSIGCLAMHGIAFSMSSTLSEQKLSTGAKTKQKNE